MILITKQKEPDEWTKFRLTPGVDYQAMPELVRSLYEEQGYICAYCMRRIPHHDAISNEDHRVEHILCREKHKDKKLNYSNMVICCPGHIGMEDHCDKKKGNEDITLSPMEPGFINTLSYTSNGEIKSSDNTYDQELNNILNLNTQLLAQNRKAMLDEIANQYKQYKIKYHGRQQERFLNKMIKIYSEKHNKNGVQVYIPYCGVAIFFLQKKLNTISK